MRHAHVIESAENYIIGVLPPHEMARIAAHLAGCTDCRHHIQTRQDVAAHLFEAIEPVTPPAPLRSAILDAAARTPQAIAAAPPAIRLRRPAFNGLRSLAIAAAVVIVTLVGAVAILFAQVQTLAATQATQQAQLAAATSPDSWAWYMLPTNKATDSETTHALMYGSPASDTYLVTATHLPPPPAAQVYRVWIVRDNQTRYGTDLMLDPQGNARTTFRDTGRKADGTTRCFITLEQRTNPPTQPTSPALFNWQERQQA